MVKYYIKNPVVSYLLKASMQLSLLLWGAGFGVAVTIPFAGVVYAQLPNASTSNTTSNNSEKTISQDSVLFVNPSAGDDNSNGSESTPLKTITRALQVARTNTTIVLATGVYSSANGEAFPIIIKSGISLQGDTANRGREIVIQGSGEYLSRSFGRQNAAVVVAGDGTVAGISITNPEQRGYGMLIESVNPQIIANTFANSIQDGILVTGNGTPKISQNYFYRNSANGITVTGSARPEISENIFQQTGFGINIAQNAAPVITGNQIHNNRAGIIVQANAKPILRNNLIQGNREDGLVAIAQAMPDLGNDTEPGNNTFRSNARFDINANASKQIISSIGNTLDNKRIAGRVNFSGTATSAIARSSVLPETSPLALAQLERRRSARLTPAATTTPTQSNTFNNTNNNRTKPLSTEVSRTEAPTREIEFAASQAASSPANTTPGTTLTTTNLATTPPAIPRIGRSNLPVSQTSNTTNNRPGNSFPTPTSLTNSNPTRETRDINPQSRDTQLSYLQIDRPQNLSTNPINPPNGEFTAPQTEVIPPPAPTNMAPVMSNAETGVVQTGAGTRYRVIVPINNSKEEEIIRFLAPGAFRTAWQGQNVIQVGVFSSTFNAEQMVRILNNNGLQAMIQAL